VDVRTSCSCTPRSTRCWTPPAAVTPPRGDRRCRRPSARRHALRPAGRHVRRHPLQPGRRRNPGRTAGRHEPARRRNPLPARPDLVPMDQAADVRAGLEAGTLRGKVLLEPGSHADPRIDVAVRGSQPGASHVRSGREGRSWWTEMASGPGRLGSLRAGMTPAAERSTQTCARVSAIALSSWRAICAARPMMNRAHRSVGGLSADALSWLCWRRGC
jgi:hypothetical protein